MMSILQMSNQRLQFNNFLKVSQQVEGRTGFLNQGCVILEPTFFTTVQLHHHDEYR